MYRAPVRLQRSPRGPRPAGGFTSPAYRGCGYGGASPRGFPAHPSGSPVHFTGPHRGYWDRSPAGFSRGSRGFDGFRGRRSFSPGSCQKIQYGSSDASVEKYFSPSMLQDPWATLPPVTAADLSAGRHTT